MEIRITAFILSGLGGALAGLMLAGSWYSGYPTLGNVYVQRTFLGILIVVAVTISFDRSKLAVIKEKQSGFRSER